MEDPALSSESKRYPFNGYFSGENEATHKQLRKMLFNRDDFIAHHIRFGA